jgi:lipopolysaccharide assembly protein B
MLETIAIYGLLLIAIGFGFYLGRRDGSKQAGGWSPQSSNPSIPGYVSGMNQLLNERQEQAIDSLLQSLPVNDRSLDTLLALGALLRRRGEIDKAIRVHQNMLGDPGLPAASRPWVELELARDHQAAGLLGRAESLLNGLLEVRGEVRAAALEHLVEIYQLEQEWQQALHAGRELLPTRSGADADRLRTALAHFHCELAGAALARDDLDNAKRQVQQALAIDRLCARAHLLQAQLYLRQQKHKPAQAALREVIDLDPGLIELAQPLYHQACRGLNDEAGYFDFLERYLARMETADGGRPRDLPHSLIEALYQKHLSDQGDADALHWLAAQLEQHPSPALTSFYLEQLLLGPGHADAATLRLIQKLSGRLEAEQKGFRCRACGFSARSLHWQCPSCRQWGTLSRRALGLPQQAPLPGTAAPEIPTPPV